MNKSIQEVFIMADEALCKVVDQISDSQWSMQIPKDMSWKPVKDLKELMNYHAYDDAWVADTLAGKTIEEVGESHDGDLLGDDPKANFRKIANTAITAVRDFNDLERKVHLSYGEWPAREYLKHITSFRGLRAVDIARLIGVDDTLDADLVQGMWDEFLPEAEEWRKLGVFGPEIKVPEDAPLQQRLLGMTGRKPTK